jgi:hypothetical protein
MNNYYESKVPLPPMSPVIITDNTQTLANALKRIEELELLLKMKPKPIDVDDMKGRITELEAQVAALSKDAARWRDYKTRKDAVIAAGMAKNALRKDVDFSKHDSNAVETRQCHTCKHSDSWGQPDCVMPGTCGSEREHWVPLNVAIAKEQGND